MISERLEAASTGLDNRALPAARIALFFRKVRREVVIRGRYKVNEYLFHRGMNEIWIGCFAGVESIIKIRMPKVQSYKFLLR